MQVLLILVASLLALGSALNFTYILPNVDGWLASLSNDNATAKWVKRSFIESEMATLKNGTNLINYYLYTRDNPKTAQELIQGNPASIHQSNFNKSNPTRIMIHGYMASHKSEVCTLIRDTYLKKEPNNFICVDWSKIAHKNIVTARFSLPSLGNDLGEFINFLGQAGGLLNKNLIVIAHSYGTHIAGFAGKYLKKSNNPLPLIVVCDPAHALFDYNDCSSRICNTDADFVESIQTTAGSYGFLKPIGDGAYYPNGGIFQPACAGKKSICSHLMSYRYLAEAIEHDDFPTKKCKSYKHALMKQCGKTLDSVKMGSVQSVGKKGVFYVPVNSKPPYGKGT